MEGQVDHCVRPAHHLVCFVNLDVDQQLDHVAVLEYASPVWHHLITKKQSDQIEAIQKRAIRIIYPCAHDMPYTSAIFLVDLPTMSDRRDQLARKLFKSTIHPIHPPYITFFPLLGNIHLSLDYESPQNFLASPPEPKNTNHSSHMLSPTIRLHRPNCVFFLL